MFTVFFFGFVLRFIRINLEINFEHFIGLCHEFVANIERWIERAFFFLLQFIHLWAINPVLHDIDKLRFDHFDMTVFFLFVLKSGKMRLTIDVRLILPWSPCATQNQSGTSLGMSMSFWMIILHVRQWIYEYK